MATWNVTAKVKKPGAKESTEFSFRVRGEDRDEAFCHADDIIKGHFSSAAVIEKDSLKIEPEEKAAAAQ